ncbi:hypothetical protein E2C01_095064 [Portunus trituberculatus]|uniref:Uncharacterized protein n=1 Tax=Portunus trituberculatus TaxID=210409 RepID=A0A5B7K2K8_PORTR|nr:hypothetical protein [Portunus trituberculatus]
MTTISNNISEKKKISESCWKPLSPTWRRVATDDTAKSRRGATGDTATSARAGNAPNLPNGERSPPASQQRRRIQVTYPTSQMGKSRYRRHSYVGDAR